MYTIVKEFFLNSLPTTDEHVQTTIFCRLSDDIKFIRFRDEILGTPVALPIGRFSYPCSLSFYKSSSSSSGLSAVVTPVLVNSLTDWLTFSQ